MTQSALDLVIAALERIREKSDHEPRASRTALARLQAADLVTVSVVTTAALSDCLSPTPAEMQTCRPYLVEQIEIIQPTVLVALGAVAVEGLLGTRATMRELRGRWHIYNSIALMITYHPAYLLRNQAPSEKRKVWEDMLQVLERLEQPISERQRNYFL